MQAVLSDVRSRKVGNRSNKPALDRVTCCSASCIDLNLTVDGAQVSLDRTRTDDELIGYLEVGQAACYETQNFNLTFGEFIRIHR